MLVSMLAACDNGNGGSGGSGGDSADPTPPGGEDPPPPAAVYIIDFADGKKDFLMMNTGAPGTDKDSKMEVATVDGASALKMTAPNGGALRLGINVSGLLGAKAADVKTVVFDVYAEYPDGNFSAVSGRITAMSGELSSFADSTWQIYLASRNPNQATLELDESFAAGANLIEFSCTTNGPAERGETPAVIYIKSIAFYDAANSGLKVDTAAGWAAPDGYGDDVLLGGWELPLPPPDGNPGGWQTWMTPGSDNYEGEEMPWQVLAASYGIVFEMAEDPESFGLVVFGKNINGWSSPNWSTNYAEYWEDGKLTVMWEDYGEDPSLINDDEEESSQAKIAMGNWNEVEITKVYLLYDADAVS